MLTISRSFASWIAIACLAFGSLMPLASVAAAKSATPAMAICAVGASWQMPGSAPAQAAHAHCLCCSNSQPATLKLPNGNIGSFHAALIYAAGPAPQRRIHPYLLRRDSWARAPPA